MFGPLPRLRLALLLLATAPVTLPAQEQPQSGAAADREILDSQRRLEQIRRERAQLREEMTRIRSRVSDLSSELANVQRQVATSADALQEIEFQITQREEQIAATTIELEETRERLAERRAVLHRRLRSVYKRGPLPTLQVLLTAQTFSDLLNRYKYLVLVTRYDRALTQEVERLERLLLTRERGLRADLLELESARRARTEEYQELAGLQDQQRVALTSVQTQEQTTARRLTQLEEDEANLTTMIVTLERRRRAEEAGAPGAPPAAVAAATLSPARMGDLAWPIEGMVLYPFGRVTQPNGTVVRWNGIGIAAEAGAPVRSVEGGTVVLAGPFEGYGPTVIVSHGAGYYSLYLYLREVEVEERQRVSAGQVLGSVGGERTAEGPHIEFQIRIPGGQAVDPLTWLRRR